jgi:hypothetical protein
VTFCVGIEHKYFHKLYYLLNISSYVNTEFRRISGNVKEVIFCRLVDII